MVIWFTATFATSVYLHWSCEFESRSSRRFSPGTPVSSTNITEMMRNIVVSGVKYRNSNLQIFHIPCKNYIAFAFIWMYKCMTIDFPINIENEKRALSGRRGVYRSWGLFNTPPLLLDLLYVYDLFFIL